MDGAGPVGVVTKRGLAGGTFLFVGVMQVDDVQVLAGGVEVALCEAGVLV